MELEWIFVFADLFTSLSVSSECEVFDVKVSSEGNCKTDLV